MQDNNSLEVIKKQMLEAQKSYYLVNDFFIIKDKTISNLKKILFDNNFTSQLTNIYPGFNNISKIDDVYMILFICNKNLSNEIIEYLHKKYSQELEITKINEPLTTTDGENLINVFKGSII